jgi:hypothetical protein
MATNDLQIRCEPDGEGWRCRVTVGDDAGATHHEVQVAGDLLARLAGGRSPEELVEASFTFLLEREPREAIMSRFELPVITRYFPEWEAEMERRLGR